MGMAFQGERDWTEKPSAEAESPTTFSWVKDTSVAVPPMMALAETIRHRLRLNKTARVIAAFFIAHPPLL